MLLELTLKNYAIVDNIKVSFTEGLNIITGETGTGKSIIVNAVNFILGDKASLDSIKSGEDEASIEALFDLSRRTDLLELLKDLGYECEDDYLILKRTISKSGRGRVYINGSNATLGVLSEVTSGLIDVFSQHEHQTLLKTGNHINYLDAFANNALLLDNFKKLYDEYVLLNNKLEELNKNILDQKEKEDYLRFQLNEINSQNLKENEDLELEKEENILSNSEKISFSLGEISKSVYDGEPSAQSLLRYSLTMINDIAHLDTNLGDIRNILNNLLVEIEEITYSIREYSTKVDFNPERLEEINNRLSEINRLKKKYGNSIEEILHKAISIEDELNEIVNIDENIDNLKNKLESVKEELNNLAEKLSERRVKASKELMKIFSMESENVGLKGAVIKTLFEKKEVSLNGIDKLTFMFSANPGETAKPLSKVASGGELSRIMLIFKELLTNINSQSILIFDEADSGIGGRAAEAVGKKIKNLSKDNQVICITHLAQVAKFADSHFSVNKISMGEKTRVTIEKLGESERVEEIGRMLSGQNITEKTIEAAKEMLANT